VWGDPSQHDPALDGEPSSLTRVPPMLSIEDGAVHSAGDSPGEVAVAPVASPSGESVATTEPEQTPEQNAVKVGYVEIVYPKRKWVLVLIPLRGLSNQMFSLVDKQPFWMPYQQIGKITSYLIFLVLGHVLKSGSFMFWGMGRPEKQTIQYP